MEKITAKINEMSALNASLEHVRVKSVSSHALLSDRDIADQHPISAVTGLEEALDNVISRDGFTSAVASALASAKERGEFDGADGKDGKTPVKGVDYYTDQEKHEFSEYIVSEIAKR